MFYSSLYNTCKTCVGFFFSSALQYPFIFDVVFTPKKQKSIANPSIAKAAMGVLAILKDVMELVLVGLPEIRSHFFPFFDIEFSFVCVGGELRSCLE